jgi:hypothetical protein
MTVYRGVKTHYYSNKLGEIFSNATFTSTSFMATVSQSFANYAGCCLSVYKLKPNVKCIWMDPVSHVNTGEFAGFGEAEILLAPGNKFKIESKRVISYNKNPWGSFVTAELLLENEWTKYNLCPGGNMTAYDTTIFEQV